MKLSGPAEGFGPYVLVTPVADGQIVPSGGASAIESGFNHMPIMYGSTQDEGNFLAAIQAYFSGKAITEADVESYVKTIFGGKPPMISARLVTSMRGLAPHSAASRSNGKPVPIAERGAHPMSACASRVCRGMLTPTTATTRRSRVQVPTSLRSSRLPWMTVNVSLGRRCPNAWMRRFH
jgi:hypothetical protein